MKYPISSIISTDAVEILLRKESYLFSLFALFASEINSVIEVNLTLYLFITALYPRAIAKCVLPTICKALHIVGKSFLAQALGNRAIYEGFTVYYIRTSTLLEEIKLSRIDGTYTNLVKRFARYKLLILDDFGVSPISVDDATNLFEIIEIRSQLSSTIITSQLPVKDWYGYLQNNTVADAILDRVVHSSHRIEIEGDSLRPKYSNLNQKFEDN